MKNTLISLKENIKYLTMSEIEQAGRKIQSIHRVKGVNEYGYENENSVR